MRRLINDGLTTTASAWPTLQLAYGWVHQAAHLLANLDNQEVLEVRRTYRTLLAQMARERTRLGALAPAVRHFLKVTRSYWSGLFAYCLVPDLPRTNNDLEQFFGSARYHERRASGRKVASPTLVVRGQVRLPAASATRLQRFTPAELAPTDLSQWRSLRRTLEQRHRTRSLQSSFRKDQATYLSFTEALLQQTLPP